MFTNFATLFTVTLRSFILTDARWCDVDELLWEWFMWDWFEKTKKPLTFRQLRSWLTLWMSSACIRSQYFCFTSTKMFFWCCGRVNEWLNVTELQKTTLEMPLANTSSFLWQYSWQVVCKSAWRERRQILCSQQRQHYLKALTNQIGSVTIYNTIESSAKLSNTY